MESYLKIVKCSVGSILSSPIMVLVLLILLSANTRDIGEKDLIGTWTGTDFSFSQMKGPDISAMIEGGKALHIGGQMILNEDHTYQIKDGSGTINGRGEWNLTKKQSFVTVDSNGENTEYQILSIDKNTLVTKHKVAMDIPDGRVEGEITLSYRR